MPREHRGLADIDDYQQQAPAHSAPAGAPQEQWRPLEARLGRLEAEVTELRKQVPLEAGGCAWGRAGLVQWEEGREEMGLGGPRGP